MPFFVEGLTPISKYAETLYGSGFTITITSYSGIYLRGHRAVYVRNAQIRKNYLIFAAKSGMGYGFHLFC
jgi:hypothetical protein